MEFRNCNRVVDLSAILKYPYTVPLLEHNYATWLLYVSGTAVHVLCGYTNTRVSVLYDFHFPQGATEASAPDQGFDNDPDVV